MHRKQYNLWVVLFACSRISMTLNSLCSIKVETSGYVYIGLTKISMKDGEEEAETDRAQNKTKYKVGKIVLIKRKIAEAKNWVSWRMNS